MNTKITLETGTDTHEDAILSTLDGCIFLDQSSQDKREVFAQLTQESLSYFLEHEEFENSHFSIFLKTLRKITSGHMVQTFKNGKFHSQEFVAGDHSDYENRYGESTDEHDNEYHSFDISAEEIKLAEYIYDCDSERSSYEEHISEGGSPEDHIYYVAACSLGMSDALPYPSKDDD